MSLFKFIFHLACIFHKLYTYGSLKSHVFNSVCRWTTLITTSRTLESWHKLSLTIRWSDPNPGLSACADGCWLCPGYRKKKKKKSGYSSPCLHFCDSSCRASGWIWFLIPPKTLEVASVAMMSGLTTAGGSWRRTPPTAPVIPRCSCSLVAVS